MKRTLLCQPSPHNLVPALMLAALIFMGSIASVFARSSAITGAEKYVNYVGGKVMTAANQRSRTHFRVLLQRYAAVRSIGMFSLGPYARRLPAGSRRKYYRLVENWVTKTFVSYSDRLRGDRFEIISSKPRGLGGAIVTTRIIGGGGGAVKWRLVKTSRGYRIYDVNISGIWLSLLMKSTFVDKLRANNGDFRVLFAYLR